MDNNGWLRADDWTDPRSMPIYKLKIGEYNCTVSQASTRSNHWRYTISTPGGFLSTGHSYPWSCKRAMDYIVLYIALRALAKVLTGMEMKESWYNEDDLDRV